MSPHPFYYKWTRGIELMIPQLEKTIQRYCLEMKAQTMSWKPIPIPTLDAPTPLPTVSNQPTKSILVATKVPTVSTPSLPTTQPTFKPMSVPSTASLSSQPSFMTKRSTQPSFLSNSNQPSIVPSFNAATRAVPTPTFLPSISSNTTTAPFGTSSLFQSALMAMEGKEVQVTMPHVEQVFSLASKPTPSFLKPDVVTQPSGPTMAYEHLLPSKSPLREKLAITHKTASLLGDFVGNQVPGGKGFKESECYTGFTNLIPCLPIRRKRTLSHVTFITDSQSYRALGKLAKVSHIPSFGFDTPSPDDIVLEARERGKESGNVNDTSYASTQTQGN
jgi:hypothetical protein